MVEENTQYGLKNYLKAGKISKLSKNHFQIDLKGKNKKAFLNIIFIDKNTIRFNYSFNKTFNFNKPNPYLNTEIDELKLLTKVQLEKAINFDILDNFCCS
jgi:hypothetical protein